MKAKQEIRRIITTSANIRFFLFNRILLFTLEVALRTEATAEPAIGALKHRR